MFINGLFSCEDMTREIIERNKHTLFGYKMRILQPALESDGYVFDSPVVCHSESPLDWERVRLLYRADSGLIDIPRVDEGGFSAVGLVDLGCVLGASFVNYRQFAFLDTNGSFATGNISAWDLNLISEKLRTSFGGSFHYLSVSGRNFGKSSLTCRSYPAQRVLQSPLRVFGSRAGDEILSKSLLEFCNPIPNESF